MAFCERFLAAGHTPEELTEEIKRRGAYHIPIGVTHDEEQAFFISVFNACSDTIGLMWMEVFHDLYGFGKERLTRANKLFRLKTEAMEEGKVTWNDHLQIMRDECNIDWEIRWVKEDPTKDINPMEH